MSDEFQTLERLLFCWSSQYTVLCWWPNSISSCAVCLNVAHSQTTEERSLIQLYPGESKRLSSLQHSTNASLLFLNKVFYEHILTMHFLCLLKKFSNGIVQYLSNCSAIFCHRYADERFMFVSTMKVHCWTRLHVCHFYWCAMLWLVSSQVMSYHKVGERLGLIIHSPKPTSPKALPAAICDLTDCSLVSDSFLERFETQRLSDSSPEITPPPAIGSLLPKSSPGESATCRPGLSSSLNSLQPPFQIPPFGSLSSASDSEVSLNLSSTHSSRSSVCPASHQVREVRPHPAHKRRRQRSFSSCSQDSIPSTRHTTCTDSSDEEIAPPFQSPPHQECKRLKKTPLYYLNHRKAADKLNLTQPHPWPHNHPLHPSDCHKKSPLYQCYQSVVKTRNAAHQLNDENLASSLKSPSSPHQQNKRVKKTPLHPLHPLYNQAENTLGTGLHLRAKEASPPKKDCREWPIWSTDHPLPVSCPTILFNLQCFVLINFFLKSCLWLHNRIKIICITSVVHISYWWWCVHLRAKSLHCVLIPWIKKFCLQSLLCIIFCWMRYKCQIYLLVHNYF